MLSILKEFEMREKNEKEYENVMHRKKMTKIC